MSKYENIKVAIDIIINSHNSNYIGENVTQYEHALLAFYIAKKNYSYNSSVVVASFFHDIGHQLLNANNECSPLISKDGQYLGLVNHEELGANYLASLGFPESVTSLVKNHVNAKRYLAFIDSEYSYKLSSASRETLRLQSGIMTKDEADNFEKTTNFNEIIRVRYCDDLAKDASILKDIDGNPKNVNSMLDEVYQLSKELFDLNK